MQDFTGKNLELDTLVSYQNKSVVSKQILDKKGNYFGVGVFLLRFPEADDLSISQQCHGTDGGGCFNAQNLHVAENITFLQKRGLFYLLFPRYPRLSTSWKQHGRGR